MRLRVASIASHLGAICFEPTRSRAAADVAESVVVVPLCYRSPLSTPRLRPRGQDRGSDAFSLNSSSKDTPAEATPGASGEGGQYPTASAAAGAAGAAATAVTATAAAAAVATAERQRGRFKLRDIGEGPFATAPPGGAGHSTSLPPTESPAAAATVGSPPAGSGGGSTLSGAVAVAGIASRPTDLQGKMAILIEQNRLLLERLATFNTVLPAALAEGAPSAPALHHPSSSPSQSQASGVERGRAPSMGALTVQPSLPPKHSSGASSSADRNQSPLMREQPQGWWGSQGSGSGPGSGSSAGQVPGQPHRRTTSGTHSRSGEGGIASGAGSGGGGSGSSGNAGGSQVGERGATGGSSVGGKLKDDGTGRRAERGRLSTLLDQLKDEIDIHASSKKDMDLELKLVSAGQEAASNRVRLVASRAES